MFSNKYPFPVFILALMALIFNAMIPAGFMPDTNKLSKGRFELTLCAPQGAEKGQIDVSYDPSAKHSSTMQDTHCVFANLLAWNNTDQRNGFDFTLAVLSDDIDYSIIKDRIVSERSYLSASPRAPPLFS